MKAMIINGERIDVRSRKSSDYNEKLEATKQVIALGGTLFKSQ